MPAETVLRPLRPPHGCRLCLPIPREYSDHAGLVKHLKREHSVSLVFECRACGVVMDKLKTLKAHQARSDSCRVSIEAASPPPPLPTDRVIRRIPTRPRKQYERRKTRSTPSPIVESDRSSPSPPSPSSQLTQARPRRRRTTRNIQAILEEDTPETQHREKSPPAPASDNTQRLTYAQAVSSSPATEAVTPRHHGSSDQQPPPSSTERGSLRSSPEVVSNNAPSSSPPFPRSFQVLHDTSRPTEPICRQRNDGSPPTWVTAWKTRFDAVVDQDMLEGVLKDFIQLAHQISNIRAPPQRQQRHRTSQRRRSSSEHHSSEPDASEIQRLYKANRKRAFDRILAGPSRFCHEIPPSTTTTPVPANPCTPPATNNPFEAFFTSQEVAHRISRGHNTAPGPDKLRYLHWRRIDPKGIIIASIFNAVQRIGYIPESWKISTTVIIHKKGDVSNLGNWRPICLSNTLGKLYTACLSDRLLIWCTTNDRISPSQKGFLNYQGCVEHNFVLQSVIQDARRARKDAFVAWLDIANAFGNIPHNTLWESLRWHGLHQDAINVIQLLYDESTTCVRTSTGLTTPILMQLGVKQGCPISPLLFILAIEPAIRKVQELGKGYALQEHPVDVLAYADDIALISSSEEGLQTQLNTISNWTDWAGINFKHAKCGTLSVRGKEYSTSSNQFFIKQQALPVLGSEDAYRHLGVPTGFSRCDTEAATIDGILLCIVKLHSSKLAPWQKVDALNTFVMPKLTFCLATGTTPKRLLNKIDRTTKRCVKKWLSLPQRASPEIVHLPYMQGGTNVTPTSQLADIAQVSHAMHLFHSKDPNIIDIAQGTLTQVVKKRITRHPNIDDLCHYLNGSMDGEFGLTSTDITSMWTRLQMATRRLKKRLDISWTVGPDNLPTISTGTNLIRTSDCQRVLCGLLKEHFIRKLTAKPDQGKAYSVTSTSAVSNHFINNGKYTRFTDWYFIHRVRMSVVALRGHKRFGNDTKRCRRCGHVRETLAHVLCHCPPNLHLILNRHNAILNRIVAAFKPKDAQVFINQRVPGFDGNCRPDMVVVHEQLKSATIIDVTTPFENGPPAFQLARDEKLKKYEPLAQHFRRLGYDTHISAFVVGALGGYDHANEATLQRLGISCKYSKLMKKLMVSDAIRWSNDIYRRHLGYHQQQQQETSRPPASNSQHHHQDY
ncbi:uncharacterized protein LOC111638606 [Centruroides sculpturatus]|uniref:uncharacterized protein LOC111638606 n=1 Tax=Centruroides sculpturatus TaxID=218467 RepID=UPI000C6DE1F2|nr:uncharacterized protein LOC111638606 [Centruroides sculpturatus]